MNKYFCVVYYNSKIQNTFHILADSLDEAQNIAMYSMALTLEDDDNNHINLVVIELTDKLFITMDDITKEYEKLNKILPKIEEK